MIFLIHGNKVKYKMNNTPHPHPKQGIHEATK